MGETMPYKQIPASDLDVLRALLEDKHKDEVVEIKEKERAYVFSFKNRRPFVVPKKVV